MSRLLKKFLIQQLSSDEMYSHPVGSALKAEKVELAEAAATQSEHGILAHIDKKYTVRGLRVDFAEKERTAELEVLLTGEGLGDMMEGKNYYAFDAAFPSVAVFIYRSLGFVERYRLTRMNVSNRAERSGEIGVRDLKAQDCS